MATSVSRNKAYNIVAVGEPYVGKSAVIHTFLTSNNDEPVSHDPPTIGLSVSFTNIILEGEEVKLQIWDLHGVDHHLVGNFALDQMDGIVLIYDLTNFDTFRKLDGWLSEIKENTCLQLMPKIIVANKVDLDEKRQISEDVGKLKALSENSIIFEASAQNGKNINAIFSTLVKLIALNRSH